MLSRSTASRSLLSGLWTRAATYHLQYLRTLNTACGAVHCCDELPDTLLSERGVRSRQVLHACCRRSIVTGGGRSNWLSGAQLVAAYVLVACVYFFRDIE